MITIGLRYQSTITNLRAAIPSVFWNLYSAVLSPCPDPKGLGDNLEVGVDWDTRKKVSEGAKDMAVYTQLALDYEAKDDHKTAISYWSSVFPNFPAYG